MRPHLAIAALALLPAACAPAYSASELRQPVIDPGAGYATLVVAREDQLVGSAVDFTVLLDGVPAANLATGQTVSLRVPPAPATVGLVCGFRSGMLAQRVDERLPFQAGYTYELDAHIPLGGNCQMSLVQIVAGN